ncbi:MAG TPA: FAD-dependent monooxygenase [Polyangiaceae bacterium]|nr:FAD-dependent monooxygenase [Polyangiaceae bacterium]
MTQQGSGALPEATDVLIVGAGPTGLAAACRLAQAGIEHVIIDRAPAGSNSSRAPVLHARTLEVLDAIGAAELLQREGLEVSDFVLRDRDQTLLRLDFSELPSAYPYALLLPQSRTELILSELHARSGSRPVQRLWRAVSLEQDREGVNVRLSREPEGPQGAEPASQALIRARYVLGCDGMYSGVREAAEIAFEGKAYPESFLLADVRMTWPLPPKQVQVFVSQGGVMVVAPMPEGLYRVVATLDPAPEQPSAPDIEAVLRRRGPSVQALVHEVSWSGRFRVHRRIAERYRLGRVLLAGDAAHVHSPAGGQGMNIGIQDGLSLADHLVHVSRNGGHPADLDAYERERRPVAEAVLRLTDGLTRLALLQSPLFRLLRNQTVRALGRSARFRRQVSLQLSELAD